MPENDIYNNKRNYERFLESLELFLIPPEKRTDKDSHKALYYCKNKANLKYFKKLAEKFNVKDLSYIRRRRLLNTLRLICHATKKDIAKCDRDDIDKITAFMHTRYHSPKTKIDFFRDTKYIWKILFPGKDKKGRIDETIWPYAVRHLKGKVDKSRYKTRKDKQTWDEFESIIKYSACNLSIQAYLAVMADSYGRPQETLYTRIKDLDLHDNYAILHITEHGKEGPGDLLCLDSYPYLLKWYERHPLKHNKEAFLFIDEDGKQLNPYKVNKFLKKACKNLHIDKPITCYSFKRNGITFARQRGDSGLEIQHRARWTSIKQLKTYDQNTQDDAFKIALAKRGLIKDDIYKKFSPKTKTCLFCGFDKIAFTEDICPKCKHIVDREKIKQEIESLDVKAEELKKIREDNQKLQESIEKLNARCDNLTIWQELSSTMIQFFIKEKDAAQFIKERRLYEKFAKISNQTCRT